MASVPYDLEQALSDRGFPVCRSERTAKYNRLLGIEGELGERARFGR